MSAHMDPEDIQNYKHTKSEAFFYERLRDQLSEKYHCFFSVRWFDKVDGRRVDSECDFLIFDPGFGFLTIEVKGGRRIDINPEKKWVITEKDEEGNITTRTLKESPFIQAEKSMRYFYDSFSSEYLQSYHGAYGFAVCFPFYKVEQKIEDAADKNLIIDARHMDDLSHRINEIFHYWKAKNNLISPFSSEQRQKFLSMVHKQISLSAAAGALIPLKEKEFVKINLVQDSIVDFLSNYKQVQIIGGAGTGKTFMAMKKMRRESYENRRVLYVCKNKELASFVADKMSDIHVECYDFNTLIEGIINTSINEVESLFDEVAKREFLKYDAVVVDEAQDFTVDEALTIRQLLFDEQESVLYVFLDENQNLFNVDFDSAFAIDTKPYILRYNIRNTGEIYRYATENTGLGADTKANNLLGVIPDKRSTKNRVQTISTVSTIINRLVQKECVKTESIVILSDVEYNNSALAGEHQIGSYVLNFGTSRGNDDEIMFRTVSEFKGLEADIVIYITSPEHASIDEKARKKEDYVAYTRARYYLYLIEQK